MDWAKAIERNSEALKGIVAALFAMLAMAGSAPVASLPRPLYRAMLRVLRPAESAMRRLIVIAARDLVVKLAPARPMPAGRITGRGRSSRFAFQLFDPRKRFAAPRGGTAARVLPRIHIFASDPRVAALWSAPEPAAQPTSLVETQVGARRLCRRLDALKSALENLPRQARRLARWRARQEKVASFAAVKSPLRPGKPPGHRRTPVHDVDRVLAECHGLARDAMEPDTS